jgi:Flp pilus assembly protein TadG
MERRRRPRPHHRPEEGATLVEFALVAPVVLLLLFGLISGCFLVYQNSALHSGATAGARAASIESPLENSSPTPCEYSSPSLIIAAVQQASPLLAVNPAPLCANGSNTMLVQTPVNGDVNIQITCTPNCGATQISLVGLKLTYSTTGLVAPFGLTYHMSATSQDPEPVLTLPT